MKMYQEHNKALHVTTPIQENKTKQGANSAMEHGKEALRICCIFLARVFSSLCTLF